MGKLAFLFPGQGTQRPGMGRSLYKASAAARGVMDAAERLMPGLLGLCFDGPMERLTRTDVAQPALFAVEMACAAAAGEIGIRPEGAAGFSLGEWAACCCAGMLRFGDAFSLVMKRGQWMQACADEVPGGMAAVLRPGREEIAALLPGHPGVCAVNFNAPGQTVVAGPLPELEGFETALRETGGRSVRLNVGGAFHSPLMRGAEAMMARALEQAEVFPPAFPVFSNLTALPYRHEDARDTLARQLAGPVLWEDSVRGMAALGFDTFLELGPGRVLSGLVSKILPGALTLQAEDPQGLEAAAARLKGRA